MRTKDGDVIIDPGDYDLGEGVRLYIFLTGRQGDDLRMWACTAHKHGLQEWRLRCPACQEVAGFLNALLLNVIDGQMICRQDDSGEFRFEITQAGKDRARAMINDELA